MQSQVFEHEAHAAARSLVLVHDEPDPEREFEHAGEDRDEAISLREGTLTEADTEAGAQRRILPQVAIATKSEEIAGQR
jgi:hypothetical protein